MLPSTQNVAPPRSGARWTDVFRLCVGVLLLAVAAVFTWLTIDALAARRTLRMELAEISHVRYGLLNTDRWVEIIVPILDAKIDSLDLTSANQVSLKPMVQNALYRLLDDVKTKMSAPAPQSGASGGIGGFLGGGNPLIVNMIVGALRPHVPEYANVVLAELGKPDTKQALKKYIRGVLADSAKTTFGSVDMRWYSYILKQHGCADGAACQQELGNLVAQADSRAAWYYGAVLGAAAVAFVLLLPGVSRARALVLLLFCVALLVGGVLTPMIEVEAKITRLSLTFLGQPINFGEQVVYYQSKSVLEVFRTLITMGRPEMWLVGVLVLMFSVVFPILKILASLLYLYAPRLLGNNRVARFFAFESSKWSMADVMALAIFMSFVAFNGLIANVMGGLKQTGADLALPTDSSKILPGYYLFIGFCMASLFLSKKLERMTRAIRTAGPAADRSA